MEELFPSLWAASGLTDLDESNFITVSKMLRNTRIYNLMKPVLEDERNAERYLRFALGNERIVQSDKLSALLKRPAEQMLQTGNLQQKNLALDVMGRFKIKTPYAPAIALVTDTATDETINLVIKLLENEPQKNSAAFIRIAQNNKINSHLRISAIHNLTKSVYESALRITESQLQSFDDSQKKELASALSSSKEGSAVLTSLYANKHLTTEAFDLASAERVSQNTKHPLAAEILVAVKHRMEEEKKSFDAKLSRYVTIVEQNAGDPDSGQKLFQTCLMCHRVGDQGQDIAPALDGSAARETQALLTALLEPDAAVERGYAVFRVTRKDNTSVEGYLSHRDGNGTTISFMGGSEVFIPIDDIKSQHFLGGRSFMPRGLIDGYTDKQVADLVAYIGTLK
jgi:putative heme-binding domain-containing protein